jgi:hypothetical protein
MDNRILPFTSEFSEAKAFSPENSQRYLLGILEGTIMKKSALFSLLTLGLLGALAATPALASSTLYTTLGPSGEFNSNNGWLVDGSSYGNQVIADPFSLSSGATVTDAVLALGKVGGADNPVNVDIESDSSGAPGSILASLTQVGTVPSYYTGSGLVTFICSGSGCNLGPDAYWLVASEPDPGTAQSWDFAYGVMTPTVNLAVDYSGSDTGPWGLRSGAEAAFQIDGPSGPVVPEPSSFLLLGSGLAGHIKRKLAA